MSLWARQAFERSSKTVHVNCKLLRKGFHAYCSTLLDLCVYGNMRTTVFDRKDGFERGVELSHPPSNTRCGIVVLLYHISWILQLIGL